MGTIGKVREKEYKVKRWIAGLVMGLVATVTWGSEYENSKEEQWQVYDGQVKQTYVTTNANGYNIIKTTPLKLVLVVNWYASEPNATAINIGNGSYEQDFRTAEIYEDIVSESPYRGNGDYLASARSVVTFGVSSTNEYPDLAILIGPESWSQKLTGTNPVMEGVTSRSLTLSGAGVDVESPNYKTATFRYNKAQSSLLNSTNVTDDAEAEAAINDYVNKLAKTTNATISLPPTNY